MKLLFVLFLSICVCDYANCQENRVSLLKDSVLSKNDSTVLHDLIKLKARKFKGKTVGAYMSKLNSTYRKIIFIESRPLYLGCIYIVYSDNLAVRIFMGKCKYINRFSEERKWDLELIKKERFTNAKVTYRSVCITGCDENDTYTFEMQK